MDDDIYEDYEQTNKSTGSGLVLAVPAMVLETSSSNMIDPSKPMVVTGSEYENLAPDNQYYEQVEFVRAVRNSPAKISDCDDSLYSIPQVLSGNNSTTGLTTRIGKVDITAGWFLGIQRWNTSNVSGYQSRKSYRIRLLVIININVGVMKPFTLEILLLNSIPETRSVP